MSQLKRQDICTAVAAHPTNGAQLSWLNNCCDTSPRGNAISIGELVRRFSTPDQTRGTLSLKDYLALDESIPEQKKRKNNEKNGPAFIPATFSVSNSRLAKDVVEIHAFVLDLDGGVSRREFEEKLAAHAYLAYTSYSHSENQERWRVIILYSVPCTPGQHQAVYAHFNALFGSRIDPRSKTTNQLWYTPACPPDAGHLFQSVFHEGLLFDPFSVAAPGSQQRPLSQTKKVTRLKAAAPSKSPATQATLDQVRAALPHIPADDRDCWIRVGMALSNDLGDVGKEIWLDWSAKSEKFDQADAEYQWESFKHETDNPVTLGTLFHLAKEHRWNEGFIIALNQNFAVITLGGTAFIMEEFQNAGCIDVRFLKKQDMELRFANQPCPSNPKQTIATAWLRSPGRREHAGIDFDPSNSLPANWYNLWRGFPVTPSNGSCELFLAFVRDVICSGHTDLYDYVIKWLAHMVQRPANLPESALVMRGKQGTGKNTFAGVIGRLLQQHYLEITSMESITGRFNGHLKNVLLLHANEAIWGGNKTSAGKLKSLITDSHQTIEQKGRDIIRVRSFIRLLVSSNETWAVPADVDDRRFVFLDVSDDHKEDAPYFAAIHAEISSGGLGALMSHLQGIDLTSWHPRQRPKQHYGLDVKLASASPTVRWWHQVLEEGDPLAQQSSPSPRSWITPISKGHLFDLLDQHCQRGRERPPAVNIFFKNIREMCPGLREERQTSCGVRTRVVILPALDEARSAFEKYMRADGQISWPNPD